MAGADLTTASFESRYWDRSYLDLTGAPDESDESDASKFNWAHYES